MFFSLLNAHQSFLSALKENCSCQGSFNALSLLLNPALILFNLLVDVLLMADWPFCTWFLKLHMFRLSSSFTDRSFLVSFSGFASFLWSLNVGIPPGFNCWSFPFFTFTALMISSRHLFLNAVYMLTTSSSVLFQNFRLEVIYSTFPLQCLIDISNFSRPRLKLLI